MTSSPRYYRASSRHTALAWATRALAWALIVVAVAALGVVCWEG